MVKKKSNRSLLVLENKEKVKTDNFDSATSSGVIAHKNFSKKKSAQFYKKVAKKPSLNSASKTDFSPKVFKQKKKFLLKMLKKKNIFNSFFKITLREHFYKCLIKHFIHIRVNSNNTIVSLTDLKGQVKYIVSAGLLKLRSSKRSYKYVYAIILKRFFDYLFKIKVTSNLYFRIIAPKHLRGPIFKKLIKPRFRKKKRIMVEFLRLLPFNGCRAPKKRRKKRQGLRVFKT